MHGVEGSQKDGNEQEFASSVNDDSEPYVAVRVSDEHGRLCAHWLSKAGRSNAEGLNRFTHPRDKSFHEITYVTKHTLDHNSLEQVVRLVDQPRLPELSTSYSR